MRRWFEALLAGNSWMVSLAQVFGRLILHLPPQLVAKPLVQARRPIPVVRCARHAIDLLLLSESGVECTSLLLISQTWETFRALYNPPPPSPMLATITLFLLV